MRILDVERIKVPNAALKLLLRMAKTLVRDAPEQPNETVAIALARLVAHIEVIDAALSARVRTRNPKLLVGELDFDRGVDTLWVFLRKFLELCAQAFGHPGLDQLTPAEQAKIELPKLRQYASMATSLNDQLFAADSTSFTQATFATQAESMAAILRLIKEDKLDEQIQVVFNALIIPTLEVCQTHYEDLVSDRMRRESGVADDFRELRARLRWLLGRYKVAIETLYDDNDPTTDAVVKQSLKALIMLSAHMSRGENTQTLDAELDAALVDAQLFDELEADDIIDGDLDNEDEFDFEPKDEAEPEPEAEAEDAAE